MPDLKTADAVVDDGADDIIYPTTIPFLLVHLACLGMLWTGVTPEILLVAFVLYVVRMFGVTAGYHRYFSHRTYRTSRIGQFLLAFLAQSSAQRGAIWWAAQHRAHHKYSDTPQDVHSPRHRGFLYAHVGWIFSRRESKADLSLVSDLTRYPELVWLDKYHLVPAFVLAIGVTLIWGWAGLFGGFFLSTSLLYHGTFMINSVAHVSGKQRYLTGDDSRNNWLLALITLGEGWHNNHHYYQTSTRQGFRWWEIDISYYTLRLLSIPRLVTELRSPPADVVHAQRPVSQGVLERVAHQLAESFPLEAIADRVGQAWWESRAALELSGKGAGRRLGQLQDSIAEFARQELPTLDELRTRARSMFAEGPHLEQVVERGRQVILERLSRSVLDRQPGVSLA
ncbi:MAG: acyl-CoA desaturase [Planctomycetota bacterium]|jgi:stearoyl-CoA desaturase (delta-9 desaturase)